MPLLSRWFLRSAILWLLLALTGAAVAAWPSGGAIPVAGFTPTIVHLFVVGWATQMILGVAYWMFPRPGPARSFGNPAAGWMVWAALNAGLTLRVAAEGLATVQVHGWLFFVSAALQLVAIVGFVVLIWPRTAPRA